MRAAVDEQAAAPLPGDDGADAHHAAARALARYRRKDGHAVE